MPRIKDTLRKICSKEGDEDYYPILEQIYNHIINFRNQPSDNRAESIRLILDEYFKKKEA